MGAVEREVVIEGQFQSLMQWTGNRLQPRPKQTVMHDEQINPLLHRHLHRPPRGIDRGADFRDRADDIRRLLAAIRIDDRFRTHVDLSHLGLVGHSLGGYTVLGLSGAWASWKMPGISAVLALSPYAEPFMEQRTLSGLSVPVMYQGGNFDFMKMPGMHKTSGAYDQSPSPKYFVEFDLASHWAWTNFGFGVHDQIAAYLDPYVKSGNFTGSILVTESGRVLFRESHGFANRPAGPMSFPCALASSSDAGGACSRVLPIAPMARRRRCPGVSRRARANLFAGRSRARLQAATSRGACRPRASAPRTWSTP